MILADMGLERPGEGDSARLDLRSIVLNADLDVTFFANVDARFVDARAPAAAANAELQGRRQTEAQPDGGFGWEGYGSSRVMGLRLRLR